MKVEKRRTSYLASVCIEILEQCYYLHHYQELFHLSEGIDKNEAQIELNTHPDQEPKDIYGAAVDETLNSPLTSEYLDEKFFVKLWSKFENQSLDFNNLSGFIDFYECQNSMHYFCDTLSYQLSLEEEFLMLSYAADFDFDVKRLDRFVKLSHLLSLIELVLMSTAYNTDQAHF